MFVDDGNFIRRKMLILIFTGSTSCFFLRGLPPWKQQQGPGISSPALNASKWQVFEVVMVRHYIETAHLK